MRTSTTALCLLASVLLAHNLSGQPAPPVNLNQSLQSTSPGRRMGVSETVILRDGEGEFISYNDLMGELKGRDPKAMGEWDHLGGILRIEAGGHEFRILRTSPSVFVDNVFRPVPKKLRVGRAGTPQIPLETAGEIIRVIDPASVAESAPVATPSTQPASPMPAPGTPAVPAEVLGTGLLNSSEREGRLPPLDVPKAATKEAAALEWKHLADAYHTRLPSRVTIVCDTELTPLADRLRVLLTEALQASCRVIPAGGRRSGPGLGDQVKQSGPDLVFDLMLAGRNQDGLRGAQAAHTIEIWAVHEALWPQGGEPADPPYKKHQLHNLALGAMLHAQIASTYRDNTVSFSLAPAYLLRRCDAPSAALLIPEALTGSDRRENDTLARAIAAGVLDYSNGLSRAFNR